MSLPVLDFRTADGAFAKRFVVTALRLSIAAMLVCAAFWPDLAALPRGAAAAGPQSVNAFDETISKARLNLRRREYDDALKLFKRANALSGNACVECLWGMAQAYSKLGASKSVLETCDRLAVAAKDDRLMAARAYNLKGMTHAEMAVDQVEQPDPQKLGQAEISFRKALEALATFELARYNLGVALIQLGREADGIAELKKFVETAKNESDLIEGAQKMIADPRRGRENYSPDFSVSTLDGKQISLADLRGKVVLVDFWGTWCVPCVVSVPSLVSLNKRFEKEPFVLLSVSSDFDHDTWRNFTQDHKMTWPQVLDRNDKVQRIFSVNSFPTYVLLDHEGVIRHRSSGFNLYVEEQIAAAVTKALAAAKSAPAVPGVSSPAATTPPNAAPAASRPASPVGVLPTPVLEALPADAVKAGRKRMLRFPLRIKNWAALPNELFQPANDLQPCGTGGMPNRLQVSVWSLAGDRLLNYCDLPSAEVFQNFLLIIEEAEAPDKVYVIVQDRRTGESARSNTVSLPPAAAR